MAGFLSNADINTITGLHFSGFLTFANDNIIVHKQLKKSFTSNNFDQRVLAGYSPHPTESTIQYIYESGVFPAIVKPNKVQQSNPLSYINTVALKGETIIKTNESGGLYITNSKTHSITISGQNDVYNLIADQAIENFYGLKFYLFGLEKTS